MRKVVFLLCLLAVVVAIILGIAQLIAPNMQEVSILGSTSDEHASLNAQEDPELSRLLDELQSSEAGKSQIAAQKIGDLSIEGDVGKKLTDRQKQVIYDIVMKLLKKTASAEASERSSAKRQIERLWKTSSEGLLEGLGDKNPTIFEASAKGLILMRDKSIVDAIIRKYGSAKTDEEKSVCIFTLGKMTEERTSLVKDRKCLSKEDSKKIASELVIPFLKKIETSEDSEKLKKLCEQAVQCLDAK
ncbi:MAG: hypothetical protein A2Z34_06350 [Planctomycetes bacterium RBG_16_59_8]|nr:MAG: hypothetical protein A2Z34_06350 [Planctomycetes bacterium RBG_16_59_8]